MLQNPTRTPGNFQLPYTTADMAERLAKKKAEKDRQDILDSLSGGLSYGKSGIDLGSVAKSVGGFLKKAYDNAEMSFQYSTPLMINGPGGGVSMGGQGTFKSLVAEPARLAVRRAVGDITAIPKVGEPSPSYTADRVREQGVALGLLGAAMDYSQFIPVVAKGAGVASDAINASRIARMNRSPFPTVKTPGAFIDVDALQGSRLPARIVDTPTTPASRLAEAQAARELTPAQVAPIEVAPATSRLTPPPFRERPVPSTSRLTLETVGGQNPDGTLNTNATRNLFIRSFNQATGEYTGVITIRYDPLAKTALVQGLAATNPMVTPQLIAAAAAEVRKLVGDVKYPLTPSASLSAYSRPFVERLQRAGLIDPDFELPEFNMINGYSKLQGPEDFANANSAGGGFGQTVIDPLSYTPGYNEVFKALVESKRQAKLAGEYGRLNTSSKQLETLRHRPLGLNDAAAYRVNMQNLRIPEHPLLKQMSDNEFDSFMGEIYTTPGSAARKLINMWEKIQPSEDLGYFAEIYANTPENLKNFPDMLKDAYLINDATRNRLMSELETILR